MKLGIFTGSRAVDGKEKNVMHVQSCLVKLLLIWLSRRRASLYSYYLRYIVMSQKQNKVSGQMNRSCW